MSSSVNPIADLLTRIRNGLHKKFKSVEAPKSKLKIELLKILKETGYISDFKVKEGKVQGTITVFLKYGPDDTAIVHKMRMISKPGKRIYAGKDDIPYIMGGYGICILSTSKGLMTDSDARKQGIGGEIICEVS